MSKIKTGSCLCKTVKYVINDEIKGAGNCHCNICRKTTGGAFFSVVMVGKNDFALTAGEGALSRHEISDLATKYFCNLCGSPIYNEHKGYPELLMVPLGSLDEPMDVTPGMNIFCESMLPWVKSIGELINFEQGPQG